MVEELFGSSGLFFLTELDPEVAIKGSRDPLGFQPIWSYLGHNLVGNLTTVTTSVRGFLTLILGHYFGQCLVREGKISEEDLVDPFLKFEQLAAYSRVAYQKETKDSEDRILGILRVKSRYSEGKGRVRISADRDGQILSNQKTYGLWGLYSVSARNSGLLHPKNLELSEASMDFVKRSVLPMIDRAGPKLINKIMSFLSTDRAFYEPVGEDKILGKVLATLHRPTYDDAEKEFFARHLVYGGELFPDGRQKRLWEWMENVNSEETLQYPFDMNDAEKIIRKLQKSADPVDGVIGDLLVKIRCLEQVLAPAEQMFDLMITMDGQTTNDVGKLLMSKWGKAFRHLDLETLKDLSAWMDKAKGEENEEMSMDRLQELGRSMQLADYETSLRLLQAQNEVVMKRRGGGPWLVLKDNVIDVRYRDETMDLSEPEDLPGLWSHSYFLNSLKVVGATVFMKRSPL